MTLTSVCTACGARQPVEAGFVGDDAKLLGDVCGMLGTALARPALAYLRLFKPHKTELRLARAVKLLRELHALAHTGRVSADERSGLERPCSPATWAAAIEQLLAHPPSNLPLSSHNYLRKVAYDLADRQDAAAERSRETEARKPVRVERPATISPARALDHVQVHLDWLRDQLKFGRMSREEYEQQVRDMEGGS